MSSLAELPELVGFFSYSRQDDEHSEGALTRLRARIQRELRLQLGRDFRLWQDTAAIPSGALWEDEIKRAIAESVFFIPIVTPSAVASKHCRFEFESFLERESALGRNDLVFPILYIRVPALEAEAQWRRDELLKIIGSRQYIDWQKFRHRDLTSPDVAEKIAQFCGNIFEALHAPWLSPEEQRRRQADDKRLAEEQERRRQAEAAAHQQAEDERRRQEAESERRAAAAGQRAEDARRQQEAESARRAEQERAFEAAKRVDTVSAMDEFLSTHAESAFAKEARSLRAALLARDEGHRAAMASDDPAVLKAFLAAYPKGAAADRVRRRLRQMEVQDAWRPSPRLFAIAGSLGLLALGVLGLVIYPGYRQRQSPTPGVLTVSAPLPLIFTGPAGGPFGPQRLSLTLKAAGPGFHWSAAAPPWINIMPDRGDVAADSSTEIAVTPASAARSLPPGRYDRFVRIGQYGQYDVGHGSDLASATRVFSQAVQFVVSPKPAPARPTIAFEKTFPGKGNTNISSLALLPDGGFVAAGTTRPKGSDYFGKAPWNAWLLRTAANGDRQWEKTYGDDRTYFAKAIIAMPDGGFAVAGSTGTERRDDRFGGKRDAWVARFNASGDRLWEKTYGGDNDDYAAAITALPEGGFVVAGAKSLKPGNTAAWILRLDGTGNLLWEKTFSHAKEDNASAIALMPDGGFLVAGTISDGGDKKEAWVLRLDAGGNLIWEKRVKGTYWTSTYNYVSAIALSPDGSFVVAGRGGGHEFWILRFDNDGSLLWEKGFGDHTSEAAAITALPGGGFMVAGSGYPTNPNHRKAWLMRLDLEGNLLWDKSYGGDQLRRQDYASAIAALPDGGVIVAGTRDQNEDNFLPATEALGWLFTLSPADIRPAK